MVEFYLLRFPRFPLRKKEHKSYFGKNRTHDFRTSRCAGYLLDHSGDEAVRNNYVISNPINSGLTRWRLFGDVNKWTMREKPASKHQIQSEYGE